MEREILFCLTALQMGLTTPEQLQEIGKDLSERKIASCRAELIKRASINPDRVKTIEQTIDLSASLSNGNYKKLISLQIYRKLIKEAFGDYIYINQNGDIKPSYPRIRIEGESQNIHIVTDESPNRYSPIKDIGSGGIGRVILAFDIHTGRNIAIKELLLQTAGQSGKNSTISPDEARFLREARLTAQLEHPSIIPVYEIGRRADNSIYYTMKYVKGRTLSDALRNSSTLNERLRFLSHFLNLCNAIAYAHSKGVIHRDIKPQNIMIGEFGETVVLDWGLAKIKNIDEAENEKFTNQMKLLKDAAAGKTVAGEVMGTPQYMSPEQAYGDVNNIDEKSDIYSLGAVLYEILTGFPPFEGGSPLTIIKDVRAYLRGEKGITPVKEIEPECPDELAAIATKALSASIDKRYQSVIDLIDDVEAYMAGRKVTGHKYSLFSYIRYLLRREKTSFIFTFILLSILSVSIYLITYVNKLKWETDINLYSERVFKALDNNEFIPAAYYATLATASTKSNDGFFPIRENYFVRSLINAFALPEKQITALDISPDSKYLSVGTIEGTISLFNLRDLRLISDTASPFPVTRLVFSNGSDKLAAGFRDGSIWIFNINPFSLIKKIKDFSTPVKGMTFTRGGTYFLAAAGQMREEDQQCPDCDIRIYSTQTFKFLDKLIGHTKAVTGLSFSDSGKYLISSSYDGYVIFWDIFDKKEIKHLDINSPVIDFAVQRENSVIVLTEDGQVLSLGLNSQQEVISKKSYNHSFIVSADNHIITGGGAFSNNRCRFCDLKIYDNKKGLSIFKGFANRITGLKATPDGRQLVASDERGNIFIFFMSRVKELPPSIRYQYLMNNEPSDMRYIKREDALCILDKSFNMTRLFRDRIEIDNMSDNRVYYTDSFAYIIDKDLILINPCSGGLFYLNPSANLYDAILSSPIKVRSIKISHNNEYIGILDMENTFYLLEERENRLKDTFTREKNIFNFAFLPDSLSAYFLRSELNAAQERFYIISLKRLMTDIAERPLIKTKNELIDPVSSENPFILGRRNTIYLANRNGTISQYNIRAPYKIKKLIHIPKSTYLLLLFEDKNYIAIYDLLKKKIISYLTGHSEPIFDADVSENEIFTAGTDGTVIVYNTKFKQERDYRSKRKDEQDIKRLRGLMDNLKLFYHEK